MKRALTMNTKSEAKRRPKTDIVIKNKEVKNSAWDTEIDEEAAL